MLSIPVLDRDKEEYRESRGYMEELGQEDVKGES